MSGNVRQAIAAPVECGPIGPIACDNRCLQNLLWDYVLFRGVNNWAPEGLSKHLLERPDDDQDPPRPAFETS